MTTVAELLIQKQVEINRLKTLLQREREGEHICHKCGHENMIGVIDSQALNKAIAALEQTNKGERNG